MYYRPLSYMHHTITWQGHTHTHYWVPATSFKSLLARASTPGLRYNPSSSKPIKITSKNEKEKWMNEKENDINWSMRQVEFRNCNLKKEVIAYWTGAHKTKT